MRKLAFVMVALLSVVAGLTMAWIRNPRIGSGRMNRIVNPMLLRRGLAGTGDSEIGTIEHVGRKSGVRRLTPVHPVATDDGFRIVVPLGLRSEWARNVVAAGHCRLQLHDTVYELDEPRLLTPNSIAGLTAPSRAVGSRVGMLYLQLHTFAEHPGVLEPVEAGAEPVSIEVVAPSAAPEEPVAVPAT